MRDWCGKHAEFADRTDREQVVLAPPIRVLPFCDNTRKPRGCILWKKMAKSKNHTAHNQTYKWHKNGIKKPTKKKYTSLKGVSLSTLSGITDCALLSYTQSLQIVGVLQAVISGQNLTLMFMQMDPKFLRNQVSLRWNESRYPQLLAKSPFTQWPWDGRTC